MVLTSLPMLLVQSEGKWQQFERDLSFTGIVGFVQKTLKCVVGHGRALYECGAHVRPSSPPLCPADGVKPLSVSSAATTQESLIPWVMANQVRLSWSHDLLSPPSTDQPCRLRPKVMSGCLLLQRRACTPLSFVRMTKWGSSLMTTRSRPSSSSAGTGTQSSCRLVSRLIRRRLWPSTNPVRPRQ